MLSHMQCPAAKALPLPKLLAPVFRCNPPASQRTFAHVPLHPSVSSLILLSPTIQACKPYLESKVLLYRCSSPASSWFTKDTVQRARRSPCSRAGPALCVCAASTSTAVATLPEVESLRLAEGAVAGAPAAAGVYAVYDSAGVLQYIGLSRKV